MMLHVFDLMFQLFDEHDFPVDRQHIFQRAFILVANHFLNQVIGESQFGTIPTHRFSRMLELQLLAILEENIAEGRIHGWLVGWEEYKIFRTF